MTTITPAELRDRLDDPSLTIVDVRTLAAYNGWRRNGEVRGGHLPGAVAFPVAWLDIVDDAEIDRLLTAKGVTTDRDIVIYGDGADDAGALATRLAALGVDRVQTLEGGAAALGGRPGPATREPRPL